MKKITGLSLEFYEDDFLNDNIKRQKRIFEIAEAVDMLKSQSEMINGKVNAFNIPKVISDGKYLSSRDKQQILKQWRTFVHLGFKPEKFTKSLYEHLHLHCGFIAHNNRSGFYYTFWNDEVIRFSLEKGYTLGPAPKIFFECERFTQAFSIWGDHTDINLAMMIVLLDEMKNLKDRLVSEAKEIYKYEISHAHDCIDREREILEEEILSLQEEMQEKKHQLNQLRPEKYMKLLQDDYEELFGSDFFADEQQQLTAAV